MRAKQESFGKEIIATLQYAAIVTGERKIFLPRIDRGYCRHYGTRVTGRITG
jgi:hypothetical protein